MDRSWLFLSSTHTSPSTFPLLEVLFYLKVSLTLGAHTQQGLRYLVCPSVCVSVCLSTLILELQATKQHVNGTLIFSANSAKNNVADLTKMAAFWQEKPASPWTTFRDPTHQLVRCVCVFITHLRACSTAGAALPRVLRCCKCYFKCRSYWRFHCIGALFCF